MVLNAIFYRLRTGCQWRYLPKDFPNWSTVATCVRTWRRDGRLQQVMMPYAIRCASRPGRRPNQPPLLLGQLTPAR